MESSISSVSLPREFHLNSKMYNILGKIRDVYIEEKNRGKNRVLSYTSPPVRKTTSPWWCYRWTIQARLPRRPPFSQHVLWQCCNPPGIPSSIMEILLFNSVFHDGVNPVSVSTLKLLLGVIGVLLLKPRASPILSICI